MDARNLAARRARARAKARAARVAAGLPPSPPKKPRRLTSPGVAAAPTSVVENVEVPPVVLRSLRPDLIGARLTLDEISQLHASEFLHGPVYFAIPLLGAYFYFYQYPPLLPLAVASPCEPGSESGSEPQFRHDAAFKLVFCPRGLDVNLNRDLIIEPPFLNGDFRSNVIRFFTRRIQEDDVEDPYIEDTITSCSSIWILAMVPTHVGTFAHQIVGGVVYTNTPGTIVKPRSVYIELLAVQEPQHDLLIPDDGEPSELAVDNTLYHFDYGEFGSEDVLGSGAVLNDQILSTSNLTLGSRRLGVMLLVLLQELHPSKSTVATHLFFQCPISSFLYRRFCRYGFKYSLRHQTYHDLQRNPDWPLCQDVVLELPLRLSRLVNYYRFGKHFTDIRLLVLDDFLSKMYPPTRVFGSPDDMIDADKSNYFRKWRTSCMLPDPLKEMSCNYSVCAMKPDIYKYIVTAEPKSPITFDLTEEFYDVAETEEDVADAFNVGTVDKGTGYGIDHSAQDKPIPYPYPLEEADESAACFWVSSFYAMYGSFYRMAYYELKINILDLLHRYVEIDPTNPVFQDIIYFLIDSLKEVNIRRPPAKKKNSKKKGSKKKGSKKKASKKKRKKRIKKREWVRQRKNKKKRRKKLKRARKGTLKKNTVKKTAPPPPPPPPPPPSEDGEDDDVDDDDTDTRTPSPVEIKALVDYDMDDMNMASPISQSFITSHFLEPRCENAMLLIFTVQKLRTDSISLPEPNRDLPKFVTQSLCCSPEDMKLGHDNRTAQYYIIVSIHNSHYINLQPSYLPTTTEYSPASDFSQCMCRMEQEEIEELEEEFLLREERRLKSKAKWKKHFKAKHDIATQLQYMYWDGHIHWGKMTKSSKVFVPLNPQWVQQVWSTKIERREWVSQPGKWIMLTPGDPSRITTAPPFETQIPLAFSQIHRTCLASSFASALFMAGYHQAAVDLNNRIIRGELQQGANLLSSFTNAVSKYKLRDANGEFLHLRRVSGYDIFKGHTPAAVILQGTDHGTAHAVSIYNQYIFDSSWPVALPRVQSTLDWSCSPAKFKSPFVVYVLVPASKQKKKKTRKRKKY